MKVEKFKEQLEDILKEEKKLEEQLNKNVDEHICTLLNEIDQYIPVLHDMMDVISYIKNSEIIYYGQDEKIELGKFPTKRYALNYFSDLSEIGGINSTNICVYPDHIICQTFCIYYNTKTLTMPENFEGQYEKELYLLSLITFLNDFPHYEKIFDEVTKSFIKIKKEDSKKQKEKIKNEIEMFSSL